MNRHRLEGNWKQLKGRAREKWGELTDDDIAQIRGRWETLIGKIQERYGKNREQAEKEVDDWFESLEDPVLTSRP